MLYCRILSGAIPEALCSTEQGQKGCRYCVAKTRRCESCGQTPVTNGRFGLCQACYIKGEEKGYCINCLAHPKKTGDYCANCYHVLLKVGRPPAANGFSANGGQTELVDDQAVADLLEDVRDEVEPEEAVRPSRWKQYELDQARASAAQSTKQHSTPQPGRKAARPEASKVVQPVSDLPLFRRLLTVVCGVYGINPGKLFKPKHTSPLLEVEQVVLYSMFSEGQSFKTCAEQARVTEDEARQGYRAILREKATNNQLAGRLVEIERQLGGH